MLCRLFDTFSKEEAERKKKAAANATRNGVKLPSRLLPPVTWEDYYKREIEGAIQVEGDGVHPFGCFKERSTAKRYGLIKKYRILEYASGERADATKIFFILENICKAYFLPAFFVLDFEKYQKERGWTVNGKPIENLNGVFFRWAIAKRARMIKAGAWLGPDMENYKYCGAWEL